jgi:hypothetical protein
MPAVCVLQENIPIEEVFEQLKCTREGLSSSEGQQRLEIFGPNRLEEKKVATASNLHTFSSPQTAHVLRC